MPIHPEILLKLLDQRKNGKSKFETHAHRAALARNSNIMFSADNHYVSKRLSSHAEATVLDKIVDRGGNKSYNLYVVRTGAGVWGGNSRPCIDCLRKLYTAANVNHIVYTNGVDYTVTTLNKLLSEDTQHTSAGYRHFNCSEEEEEEEEEEENKPNL
jgi:cytidine deaminase